jgi:hypothetical protein
MSKREDWDEGEENNIYRGLSYIYSVRVNSSSALFLWISVEDFFNILTHEV